MENLNDKIIEAISEKVSNNGGIFKRLLDKNDDSVSSTNFFVLLISLIAALLLLAPVFILGIEIYYNHTIGTDLTGLAAYIGSVSSMIIGVGLMKAWTSTSNDKYKTKIAELRQQEIDNCYIGSNDFYTQE